MSSISNPVTHIPQSYESVACKVTTEGSVKYGWCHATMDIAGIRWAIVTANGDKPQLYRAQYIEIEIKTVQWVQLVEILQE